MAADRPGRRPGSCVHLCRLHAARTLPVRHGSIARADRMVAGGLHARSPPLHGPARFPAREQRPPPLVDRRAATSPPVALTCRIVPATPDPSNIHTAF